MESPMTGLVHKRFAGPGLAWQLGVALASSVLWGVIELGALCRARWMRRR